MENTNLNTLISKIENPNLRACCEKIYKYPEFFEWPGSISQHHNRPEGLIEHTIEVADYALHQSLIFPAAKKDIIITAALWHDLAKIWDYELITVFEGSPPPRRFLLDQNFGHYKKGWTSTEFYKSVHHITGSNCEFTHHALNCGVDRKTTQEVQGCIASHHGRREFGSPVEPRSLEAYILSQADMLSAHYGAWKDKKPE